MRFERKQTRNRPTKIAAFCVSVTNKDVIRARRKGWCKTNRSVLCHFLFKFPIQILYPVPLAPNSKWTWNMRQLDFISSLFWTFFDFDFIYVCIYHNLFMFFLISFCLNTIIQFFSRSPLSSLSSILCSFASISWVEPHGACASPQ